MWGWGLSCLTQVKSRSPAGVGGVVVPSMVDLAKSRLPVGQLAADADARKLDSNTRIPGNFT